MSLLLVSLLSAAVLVLVLCIVLLVGLLIGYELGRSSAFRPSWKSYRWMRKAMLRRNSAA
mgnify:CR=1 FL=1